MSIKNLRRSHPLACLFICLTIFSSPFLKANEDQDYEALLLSEHTVISLCGDLNYKRQSRDCTQVQDLKHCLELNEREPLYVYQEKSNYSCVNTSYSAGVDIIKNKLENSQTNHEECLSRNIRLYYKEVVHTKEFSELSQRFEKSLGIALKLNYGVDTREGFFNLQMNTEALQDLSGEMINISIGQYKKNNRCQRLSPHKIIANLTDQYNRLSLKFSHKDHSYYEDIPLNAKVFNSSRATNRPQQTENKRSTASLNK